MITTIRLASEAGLVGGSIEDATGDPEHPIFAFDLAVERVAAAADAARSLKVPFVASPDHCTAAMAGLREAAKEVQEEGTFGYLDRL